MKDDFRDFYISDELKKKLKSKEWIKKELAKGKSAQEILQISDEVMQKLYNAAYRLFDNARYVDAADAFLFLVTLNPRNYEYWLGLGLCAQLNREYEAAFDAYEMAAYQNLESPLPYFYLAKCLFAMHDRDSALLAIDLAIDFSDSDEYADIHQEALAAKRALLRGK